MRLKIIIEPVLIREWGIYWTVKHKIRTMANPWLAVAIAVVVTVWSIDRATAWAAAPKWIRLSARRGRVGVGVRFKTKATTTTLQFRWVTRDTVAQLVRQNLVPPRTESMLADSELSSSSTQTTTAATTGWKDRLRQLSNVASILCAIDCTVLPILTVLLPLGGVVAISTPWLHQLSHQVALYFVVPVGLLTTGINAWSQSGATRRDGGWVLAAAMGLLGVVLVGLANASDNAAVFGWLPMAWRHAAHHGLTHRLVNLAGCALLWSSNYWSRRQCASSTCTHDH
jgi:MerC mercury resistance protein